MFERGARLRKADLHIHTPASKCYAKRQGGHRFANSRRGSQQRTQNVIGITDHNDIAFIDETRREANKRGIAVFPGIEITTHEAHVLALFEPDFSMQRLNEFLPIVGILGEHRGKREAMAHGLEDVLKVIDSFGGLAIAAHANSSNGLLNVERGQYKIGVCKNPLLTAWNSVTKMISRSSRMVEC